jgi:hypothetical protein
VADYASDHAAAYADILEAGAAVTLTRRTAAHTASTDATEVTRSSIAGAAVKVRGNPKQYAPLGVTEHDSPTLLFAAATYGDAAQLNDELTWGGEGLRVVSIDETNPDGTAPIVARLVVSR